MKKFLYIKKSRWLLLTLLTLFLGASPTWADELTVYNDADYSSDYVPFDGYDADAVQQDQMIYPSTVLTDLVGTSITKMVFYYKKNETSGTNVGNWIISMGTTEATTLSALDTTTPLTQVFSGAITPNTDDKTITITFDTPFTYTGGNLLVEFNHPVASGYKKFTFWCAYISPAPAYSKGATRTYLPKTTFTYENVADGAAFAAYDGSAKLTSPYSYNFGLTTAGTTKVITLKNPGTEDVNVSVEKTGDFGATLSAATISAGDEVSLTITMPEATGNGTITVKPEGLDDFVINVSGTVRDPNKVYLDFSDGQIPDGWTSVAIGTYASSYGSEWTASTGYVGQSGSSSSYEWAFTSPKLTFENGETILFETQKYSSSTVYTPSIKVEYSLDNSTWTTIGSAFTDDAYDTWTSRSVTIPVDGVKYIRFSGWNIKLRNIYGGELPNEPKMVVTQPTTLDYGVITEATQKTFTIANTGKATLEGINVTSSNAAFTISNAPTSLAAGGSQEVTITMSADNTGAFSSDITVSATGMENVQFTVSGAVMPNGMFVVDFNDNVLPTGWGNNASYKWNFSEGKAYCTNAAELTTPKLQFSDGDLLAIKITSYDNYDGNYIEITGSTDGSTWDAFTAKKYVSRSQIPYGSYATLVVTDIPTTVKYLKFKGYYVRVDEIAGLTYAPVLSVTTGDPAAAVSTPANYDFGEAAANANVTYNFANAGAGTINITNVAITGDGAAAYSTNWTESTAAPFDLTITRAYDATRAGAAQDAVVTVTTSEGDFIINVTGTDKAANAPELTVTPSEDADFGTQLKAAPAAKTYTITNSGTGTLTGNILSSTSDFTVSESEFSLGAAESMTFDITLNFDTNYGAKASVITVHPTIDGLEDVTINATASTLDPDAWTEDFSAGTLPTGWTQGTWTIGTFSYYENKTNMALAPSGSTAGTLITPCLSAKEGDVLTWDAYFNWYDEAMTVEYSNDDQATWTKIYDAYKTEDEFGSTHYTHKAMSFTAPADGNYYLRFTSTYSNGVDNFAGFKLNLPDHIMAITASSIPTSGSYSPSMKATQSFNATVTVKESRGVDEENVVAKLYMGDEVIGTSEATTVEAGESKQITIICTPTVAATDGVQMHIEVEWAGSTLSTDAVTRYVAEFVKLELTETEEDLQNLVMYLLPICMAIIVSDLLA